MEYWAASGPGVAVLLADTQCFAINTCKEGKGEGGKEGRRVQRRASGGPFRNINGVPFQNRSTAVDSLPPVK